MKKERRILAIDPGSTDSAFVVIEGLAVVSFGKCANVSMLDVIGSCGGGSHDVAIEMIKSYGNIMGDSVLMTCVWIGRFTQVRNGAVRLIPRKTVVSNLCRSVTAGDKEVRRAVIDVFGGDSAIGTKKAPGPLYGVTGDVWSALALALAFQEIRELETLDIML